MAGAPVSEAEVRALLVGPLEVGTSVSWKLKSNDSWAEAQLAVRQPLPGATLSVRLTVNLLAPSKYSIILLLNDAHRIRSLDVGGNHQNKHTDQNRWVHQTHEHQWTDACHGAWACSVP